VYQVAPRNQDRGQDGSLRAVELTETSYGKSQTYHAGVVAEALEARRGEQASGNNRLDDAPSVERPRELGGVVLHPPDRVEACPLPRDGRGRWLED
jgi:hypothetical protein